MSKMVNCKACDKEIARGVKKCVHCGKDQRNFLKRHKILTGILVIIVFVIIAGLSGGNSEGETSDVSNSSVGA